MTQPVLIKQGYLLKCDPFSDMFYVRLSPLVETTETSVPTTCTLEGVVSNPRTVIIITIINLTTKRI